MQRTGALLAHLLALPAAAVLAVVVAILIPLGKQPAVDVELDDTMFVVAHFHPLFVLGACVGVASLVAYRWGRLNWALFSAWGLLFVHILAAGVLYGVSFPPSDPRTYVLITPQQSVAGGAYLGSALGTFLMTLIGLSVSHWESSR